MQVENLTEQNVTDLKAKLKSMKLDNPELQYQVFKMDARPPSNDKIYHQLLEVEERIDELHRKFDLVFDGHVLLNGNFKKIKA